MLDIYPVQLKSEKKIEDVQGFDWEKTTKEQQENYMKNFESLQVRKMKYDKPLAIILNPNSGLMLDKRARLESYLKENNIPFEVHETKKAGDSFDIPMELDLNKYSALVSCGGDGTLSDIINGMMSREDQVRLPIAIIPNGSGNAAANGLGMQNTDLALDALKTRTVS
jgi:diacylglycerol kinase family enzyme